MYTAPPYTGGRPARRPQGGELLPQGGPARPRRGGEHERLRLPQVLQVVRGLPSVHGRRGGALLGAGSADAGQGAARPDDREGLRRGDQHLRGRHLLLVAARQRIQKHRGQTAGGMPQGKERRTRYDAIRTLKGAKKIQSKSAGAVLVSVLFCFQHTPVNSYHKSEPETYRQWEKRACKGIAHQTYAFTHFGLAGRCHHAIAIIIIGDNSLLLVHPLYICIFFGEAVTKVFLIGKRQKMRFDHK